MGEGLGHRAPGDSHHYRSGKLVKQVAAMGFRHEKNFIRAFKVWTG